MKKLKILIFAGGLLAVPLLQAVDTIKQETGGKVVFDQTITYKAYDRYAGKFYVASAVANGVDTISSAARGVGTFTGLATNAETSGKDVTKNIALIPEAGAEATLLAFQGSGATAADALKIMKLADGSFLEAVKGKVAVGNNAYCLTDDSAGVNFSLVAGGYSKANGAGYAFIRVLADAGATKDLTAKSGILGFKMNTARDSLVRVGVTAITQATNFAVKLDKNRGGALDGSFLRNGSASGSLDDSADNKVTDMYWDSDLETLFVAGHIVSKVEDDFTIAISKVKFKTAAEVGSIIISDVIPAVNASKGDLTAIFNSQADATSAAYHINITKIRTMHTSTGKYYLIVNGGVSDDGKKTGNQIWALRYDPNAVATLADSGTGQIVQNNNETPLTVLKADFKLTGGTGKDGKSLDGGNVGSLTIGGDVAPWEAKYSASDMEVVGDTVYVSFSADVRKAADDPGVWSSTAMFDDNGVVIGWTKWERVFPSQGGIVASTHMDRTPFFAIDADADLAWQITGTEAKVVVRTKIDAKSANFAAKSLPAVLNDAANFANGCTCCLDLPQGTPNIGETTNQPFNSIVLFGGIEKVAFARTSGEKAREIKKDFTVAADFKLTTLSGAGVIRCLGYSRKGPEDTTTQGYFLAGADTGLWIYAKTDATVNNRVGFNTQVAGIIEDLTNVPFDNTFSWYQLASDVITGPVTAIEANGKFIFVVEQDVTTVGGIKSRLWRIPLANNLDGMKTPVKIAESGVGDLPTNSIFTGFKIVTDVDTTTAKERGILSTNEGLWLSGEALATMDVTTKKWTSIDADKNAYHSIYAPKRVTASDATHDGLNLKVLGITVADGTEAKKYYQNAALQEFGFAKDASAGAKTVYTSAAKTDGGLGADKVLDRTTTLWTDGARRLYTRFNATETANNTIQSLPFRTSEWGMTTSSNLELSALFPDLTSIPRIYWIENISALGIILMGTDTGVIAFE